MQAPRLSVTGLHALARRVVAGAGRITQPLHEPRLPSRSAQERLQVAIFFRISSRCLGLHLDNASSARLCTRTSKECLAQRKKASTEVCIAAVVTASLRHTSEDECMRANVHAYMYSAPGFLAPWLPTLLNVECLSDRLIRVQGWGQPVVILY